MRMIMLALATLAAATAPLLPDRVAAVAPPVRWPSTFDGKPLTQLPAAASDKTFTRGFPGHVAHFSDGTRHILLRQVDTATRSLHPSQDCYRAMGYETTPLPLVKAPDGQSRACFAADKGNEHFQICEEVRDAQDNSFPEVTAWYWPALTGASQGPWVAATIVEFRPTAAP
jgi:hypothetical protein